ncbi:hypothetical protein ACFSL6_23985 [Paenibacillus thailandensis]|uniref:Uncharacterized protein n=1 Tax=Paenibacillus thailandensis TaxID=393250 RepID=A0ABW5R554_9BACL
MKKVAYYVPTDKERMLYLAGNETFVAELLMTAFLMWTEKPDSDTYNGPPVLIGQFSGQRNNIGGYDGRFTFRGRIYDVVDSIVTNPPDESAAEADET